MKDYYKMILEDLKQLIAIPSIGGDSEGPGAPFGRECSRALEFMLQRGKELGFSVYNCDGYSGHIEYGSRGPVIALLCHLDVVPAGDGWNHPPFEGVLDGGRLYGRGASDNKGPAVSALYTLLAFSRRMPDPPFRVRIVFGCDEERSMSGIDHYIENIGLPDYAIVPDAEYPMVTREKGICDLEFSALVNHSELIDSIRAGAALNQVPDFASALIAPGAEELFRNYEKEKGFGEHLQLRDASGRLSLESRGTSAHGGNPEMGRNAIALLCSGICSLDRHAHGENLKEPLLAQVYNWLGTSLDGSGLGVQTDPEPGDKAGGLTINWGRLAYSKEDCTFGLNLRYPVGADYSRVERLMQKKTEESGFTMKVLNHLKDHHVDENSTFVSVLRKAYESLSGDDGKPQSISGGTYARKVPGRGVAFGAAFPGTDNRAHQSDEFIDMDELIRHSDIVLHALELFAKV